MINWSTSMGRSIRNQHVPKLYTESIILEYSIIRTIRHTSILIKKENLNILLNNANFE